MNRVHFEEVSAQAESGLHSMVDVSRMRRRPAATRLIGRSLSHGVPEIAGTQTPEFIPPIAAGTSQGWHSGSTKRCKGKSTRRSSASCVKPRCGSRRRDGGQDLPRCASAHQLAFGRPHLAAKATRSAIALCATHGLCVFCHSHLDDGCADGHPTAHMQCLSRYER